MTSNRSEQGRAAQATKRKSELIRHKEIVERGDISLAEIKRRVAQGEWPPPHSVMGRVYRWRRADIEPWLVDGAWPEGASFKARVGRGRESD